MLIFTILLALAGLLPSSQCVPVNDYFVGSEPVSTPFGDVYMPIGSVMWNDDPYTYYVNRSIPNGNLTAKHHPPPQNWNSSIIPRGNQAAEVKKCDEGYVRWVNQATRASPWLHDCEQMVRNLRAHGATWTLLQSDRQRRIADYATCAFGVELRQYLVAYIGDEDIAFVVHNAYYNREGCGFKFPDEDDIRLGCKGMMGCAPYYGHIWYGIYHR
ncbi:hypothetical protein QBC35DRAFT_539346 [Podospora australis]|uniref:Ecp2 effector protein-like domain-containing protein n=1 Tax=Podospora australis TaxID=1536484 RepID=A0AAN6WNY2_9PEZI|nr:hypothetical protein QBC35DRAFT_539346 [Podospora australis]